jgi:hypothetical protein
MAVAKMLSCVALVCPCWVAVIVQFFLKEDAERILAAVGIVHPNVPAGFVAFFARNGDVHTQIEAVVGRGTAVVSAQCERVNDAFKFTLASG